MAYFNGFGEDVIKSYCSDIFVKGITNGTRVVDVTVKTWFIKCFDDDKFLFKSKID